MCASWDAVLLIEDGVYGALAPCVAIGKAGKIYALRADIAARSLSGRVDERVIIIDDREFVELATEYDKVISWY